MGSGRKSAQKRAHEGSEENAVERIESEVFHAVELWHTMKAAPETRGRYPHLNRIGQNQPEERFHRQALLEIAEEKSREA